jgi:hypothetical protein
VALDGTIADRVQRGVPAVVVGGAVVVVAAGLHGDDRHAAGVVPELGVDGVGLHGALGDGVHGRRVAELVARGQRRAVEDDVVAVLGAASEVDLVGCAVVIR